MKYKKINYNNDTYIRINRRKALDILQRPATFNGITLYILPINADPASPWINGFFEIKNDFPFRDACDNINELNEIQYYNCGSELGDYLKFYIKEGKLQNE